MYIEYIVIKLIVASLILLLSTTIFLLFYIFRSYLKHKSKDDYLYMLVHDIRSPLTVIKGTADILLNESENIDKKEKSALLNQVQDISDKLLLLVSDILDLSKMQSGKFKLIKSSCDLNENINKVVKSYSLMASKNNIIIKTNLDKDIPHVTIDSEKIQRVLTNLISNAIKYTPEEGTIQVSSYIDKDRVNVCVSDTGIGISDEMKHKLFTKFVQGTKTFQSRKSSSSGLGLNVSKSIINLHKGKIWIEDNKPKGSKFIFSIPLNLPEF